MGATLRYVACLASVTESPAGLLPAPVVQEISAEAAAPPFAAESPRRYFRGWLKHAWHIPQCSEFWEAPLGGGRQARLNGVRSGAVRRYHHGCRPKIRPHGRATNPPGCDFQSCIRQPLLFTAKLTGLPLSDSLQRRRPPVRKASRLSVVGQV